MFRRAARLIYLFLPILVGAPPSAIAADCQEVDQSLDTCLSGHAAGTTGGMIQCVVQASQAWTKRMESAYQSLHRKLDPPSRALLEQSQQAWLAYRSKDTAFAHGPWSLAAGTLNQANVAVVRLQELRARTLALETYLASQ
jgi:uncharacterized protein YecT (DUF1311 family)